MRSRMFLFFMVAALLSPFASANSGGGAAAPQPLVFTVNLGASHYLRVEVVLEPAKPEAAHELEIYRPRVVHEVILLLSGQDEAKMRSLEGKKALMEEILDAVNHVIHSNRKNGVKEVLFPAFIIQ